MAEVKTIKPSDYTSSELRIKYLLEAKGYLVQDSGYETYFTASAKDVIGRINRPTSLYVRTNPDKVVIGSKESLLLEIKDATQSNIAIEAFPLLIHRHLFWTFNILTLYLFDADDNITGEFVENLPIDRVIIPARLKTAEYKYWLPLLTSGFPNNHIERISTGGSGDPFVIISKESRKSLRQLSQLF